MTASLPNIETLLHHQDWVRALARSLVADPTRAEDVAQLTMLEAIERPPRDLSRPKSWLAKVARNTAGSLARQDRSRKQREQVVARSDQVLADPADVAQRAEAHKRVVDAVFELKEPYHSVILLRYFEDLDAHEIAAQLDRPVATVRTQLQRGLERIRQRLDRSYGDRQAWCTAMLPLLRNKQAVIGVPILGSLGALAMGKWTLSAISLVATVFLSLSLIESLGDPLDLDEVPSQVKAVEPDLPPPIASQREELPEASVTAPEVSVRGRLFSLDGQALSGIPVVYEGWQWPRLVGNKLSGSSRSWTSTPERLAELRSSESAMKAVVALFAPFEQQAEALLRGELVEALRTVTDAAGRFEFVGPAEIRAADLVLGDRDWLVCGSGWDADAGEQCFLAGPGVQVTGQVVDESGKGMIAFVQFSYESNRLPGLAQNLTRHGPGLSRSVRSTTDGFFDLGMVPRLAGLRIQATLHEFVSAHVLATDVSGPVRLTLSTEMAVDPKGLVGIVYHADGSPAAGAEVIFGQVRGKTDQAGRFALSMQSAYYEPDSPLLAYIIGEQAAIETDFGARYRSRPNEEVVLRLGGAALSISGRVVDADGVGRVGVRVLLGNGAPEGIQPNNIESLIGNRRFRPVLTDADGQFTLNGLLQRDYVLRAIDLDSLLVIESDPVAAGTRDLVLSSPPLPFFELLEGVLVDRKGNGIAGAEVRVMTEGERGRRGYHSISRSDTALTDKDGRFTLSDCPREHVYLSVSGNAVIRQRHDVDDVAMPMRLVGTRKLRFRIRNYVAVTGDRFVIHDADGKKMSLEAVGLNLTTQGFFGADPIPGASIFHVSEDASTLVMMRHSKVLFEYPLRLRTGILNEIDL